MPDNKIYYHIAYIVATAIYGAYALILYTRWKRVRSSANSARGS